MSSHPLPVCFIPSSPLVAYHHIAHIAQDEEAVDDGFDGDLTQAMPDVMPDTMPDSMPDTMPDGHNDEDMSENGEERERGREVRSHLEVKLA